MDSWSKRLDHINLFVTSNLSTYSTTNLNWKLNNDAWSSAQILDHLIRINESYFPIFEKIISNSYKPTRLSLLPYYSKVMGKTILRSVQPSNQKKTSTFEIWEPSYSEIDGSIVEKFMLHQTELLNWTNILTPFIDKKITIHSPANKYILYSLENAIDIIVSHEERHLLQLRQLQEDMLSIQ